ncbi:MAG: 30S ribosomal protein S14 [Gammaproteobacteria bacterium RIFOXYB2_FULL_38_6]|nr:MAG: 30S ribosomal protein S14 [Gammaproteobacteria bacterium RIFOXYB2_FULL_38_6]
MAKTSSKERNKKRIKLSQSAEKRKKRNALKEAIRIGSFEEKEKAVIALQKMKRDTSPIRIRTRCNMCGRPRAVYRKFGLCRMCLRNAMVAGDVPGLKKSSW